MRFALVAFFFLGACKTTPPVNPLLSLPTDTAQECGGLCQRIGLKLSAVVVVADHVGCVCEVQPGAARASASGSAAASAGTIITLEAAEAAHRQQQQQQERQKKEREHQPGSAKP